MSSIYRISGKAWTPLRTDAERAAAKKKLQEKLEKQEKARQERERAQIHKAKAREVAAEKREKKRQAAAEKAAAEKLASIERRKQHEHLRARAAVADGKDRQLASRLKRRLRSDHPCPYCGGPLGTNFHADHIYPRSKGGLSTEKNLVNVCSGCNISKGNKTLTKFIEDTGRDREIIEDRLKSLGKEY